MAPQTTGDLVGIEHPTGTFEAGVDLDADSAGTRVRSSSVIRTARRLFDGTAWSER